jgi:hypothetical protein
VAVGLVDWPPRYNSEGVTATFQRASTSLEVNGRHGSLLVSWKVLLFLFLTLVLTVHTLEEGVVQVGACVEIHERPSSSLTIGVGSC